MVWLDKAALHEDMLCAKRNQTYTSHQDCHRSLTNSFLIEGYQKLVEVYSIAHGLPPPVPFRKDSGLDFSAYTGKSFGVKPKCLV